MDEQEQTKALSVIKGTVCDSKELLAEIGDFGVEFVTDSEVLEKIPMCGWIVKTGQIWSLFHKKRLYRNTCACLEAVSKGDRKLLVTMFEDLKSDPDSSEEFIDTFLSILIEGEKPLKSYCSVIERFDFSS